MHADNPGLGLVNGLERVFLFQHPGVFGSRDVVWDHLQISRRDQIVQRLRRFLLVQRVLIDDFIERRQILSQVGFAARMMLWLYMGKAIDSRIRIRLMTTTISISVKPRLRNLAGRALDLILIYQSLYFVPSKAVWSDFV